MVSVWHHVWASGPLTDVMFFLIVQMITWLWVVDLKTAFKSWNLNWFLLHWCESSRLSSCALYYSAAEMLRSQLEHFVRGSQCYSMYYLHTHSYSTQPDSRQCHHCGLGSFIFCHPAQNEITHIDLFVLTVLTWWCDEKPHTLPWKLMSTYQDDHTSPSFHPQPGLIKLLF